MSSGHIANPTGEAYCETIAEMQARCEEMGVNFRVVMMALAEAWLKANAPDKDTDEQT